MWDSVVNSLCNEDLQAPVVDEKPVKQLYTLTKWHLAACIRLA